MILADPQVKINKKADKCTVDHYRCLAELGKDHVLEISHCRVVKGIYVDLSEGYCSRELVIDLS